MQLIAWPVSFAVSQTVVINEFMASNGKTIEDEDGDTEDWIELYNYGEEPVDISGWALSDDFANPGRWVFPDTLLEPGEFLLVWASGKDRQDSSLHTNFKISSQGEELILSDTAGSWVDLVPATSVPTDISYGRKPDGGEDWFYFDDPTPGLPNTTENFSGITSPPVFSEPSGFFTDSFHLELVHPDTKAQLIYTLDGSWPDVENLQGSHYLYKNQYAFYPDDDLGEFLEGTITSYPYEQGIWVSDPSQQPDHLTRFTSTVHAPDYIPECPVSKAVVVRAKALKDGYLPSQVVSHTYFVHPRGRDRYTLPVVSFSLSEAAFFDYEEGIYTPGKYADKWRDENPGSAFSWPYEGNFHRRGIAWEHPANMTYFPEGEENAALNQDMGVRIHGGGTRSFPMKSLRLYARNAYGPSRFHYPFFEDKSLTGFNRLLLRNSGQDFTTQLWQPHRTSRTMFRDAFIQNLVHNLNFETQAYAPVVVFINGEYWGIQNFRERYDKHYLERVFGVDPENIDLLTYRHTAKEGDNQHYLQTLNYIETYGLADSIHFSHIKTQIDVENFIDYQVANIFIANTDWPGNNIDFWRLRTDSFVENAPLGHDGRWRWLLYDTDFAFGLIMGEQQYKHNTLAFATEEDGEHWPNPPWSTFLLRSFLENESFRIAFINRFADLMNSTFRTDHVLDVLGSFRDKLLPEMEEHFMRWAPWEDLQSWEQHLDVLRGFAGNRPAYQRKHIKEMFGIEKVSRVTLDVSHPYHGSVKINSINVDSDLDGVSDDIYPWHGLYFKGIPITIKALPSPGYTFSHWEGDFEGTDSVITITPSGAINVKAHFTATGEETLLAYWLFDDSLPNDTPLSKVEPRYAVADSFLLKYESCYPEYPYQQGHPYWRQGSMERRNNPTPLNYYPHANDSVSYENAEMRGLQVRTPFRYDENRSSIIFHLPTKGVKDLLFRFAAKDEGADSKLVLDYALDSSSHWSQKGLYPRELNLTQGFQLFEVDLGQIEEVRNKNDGFRLRISFVSNHQEGAGRSISRATFNNFSLHGVVCMAHTIRATSTSTGKIEPPGNITLSGCAKQTFLLTPLKNHVIEDVKVDGRSFLEQVQPLGDGKGLITLENPDRNQHVHASFKLDNGGGNSDSILLFPNPVKNNLTISSSKQFQRIEIFDLKGTLIKRHKVRARQTDINLAEFAAGVYVVKISGEGFWIRRKIVKTGEPTD